MVQALASDVTINWQVYVVCLAFIFLIHPIVGFLSLGKLGMSNNKRSVTAGLGIRGIGTLYYIAYAINKGVFSDDEALKIWVICVVMIARSVFLHGLTANRLLALTKN